MKQEEWKKAKPKKSNVYGRCLLVTLTGLTDIFPRMKTTVHVFEELCFF